MEAALSSEQSGKSAVTSAKKDGRLPSCRCVVRGEMDMAKTRFVAITTMLLLGPCAGRAQSLAPGRAKQVDQLFAKWDRSDSPGCALGVYRGGQVAYTHGYGMEDLNEG